MHKEEICETIGIFHAICSFIFDQTVVRVFLWNGLALSELHCSRPAFCFFCNLCVSLQHSFGKLNLHYWLIGIFLRLDFNSHFKASFGLRASSREVWINRLHSDATPVFLICVFGLLFLQAKCSPVMQLASPQIAKPKVLLRLRIERGLRGHILKELANYSNLCAIKLILSPHPHPPTREACYSKGLDTLLAGWSWTIVRVVSARGCQARSQ